MPLLIYRGTEKKVGDVITEYRDGKKYHYTIVNDRRLKRKFPITEAHKKHVKAGGKLKFEKDHIRAYFARVDAAHAARKVAGGTTGSVARYARGPAVAKKKASPQVSFVTGAGKPVSFKVTGVRAAGKKKSKKVATKTEFPKMVFPGPAAFVAPNKPLPKVPGKKNVYDLIVTSAPPPPPKPSKSGYLLPPAYDARSVAAVFSHPLKKANSSRYVRPTTSQYTPYHGPSISNPVYFPPGSDVLFE